jgi:biotin carboxyl carrier protein
MLPAELHSGHAKFRFLPVVLRPLLTKMLQVEISNLPPLQVRQSPAGPLLNGDLVEAQIQEVDTWCWQVQRGGREYLVYLQKYDPEQHKMRLKVNGKLIDLKVERDEDRLLATIGKAGSAGKKITELRAPMPGLVRRLEVEVGQSVSKGSALLVLEAMKMENILKATDDVRIANVPVAEGQAVEKGAVLLRFE